MLFTKLLIWACLIGLAKCQSDNYRQCMAQPHRAGESGQIVFVEPALTRYHRCPELHRNDCLFYHEAGSDKCVCLCNELVTSNRDYLGGPGNNQGNPARPYNPGPAYYDRCFHGDDVVSTNIGSMKMSEIVGRNDVQVLTRGTNNELEMSPIVHWTHANEKLETEFIIFETESGRNLSITSFHLIYETDCRGKSRTVFSQRVNVGKCLYVVENGKLIESKVIGRRTETKRGIYAPITSNGNVVVNDVLASCYTNIENEALERLMYSYVMKFRYLLDFILPESWMHLIFGSPFSATVEIPEFMYSLVNLAKGFVRLN